ncbi:hypothetical protein JCM3766R1_007203 [Sporobolomyces carnicolor]
MVYLPSELVREIIELAVPGSFHETTYRDRLSTLATLCLVSRQFHAIAQTLLDEIIKVSHNHDIETLPTNLARHLIFDQDSPTRVERALKRSHSLRSLTLRTTHRCNLLDPRSLASLKVLGLFAFDNILMSRHAEGSVGMRSLMPQLDAFVVQCHLYDMGCFPEIDPSRILVDTFVEAVGTARMAIQHVRFTASWWSKDRTIRAEGLALTLTSRPRFRKLVTVYLDSEQFSDLDLTLFKAAFHRECPSMSFEVVIEPQARTVSSLNSSISQDFVSRMRKEKSRNTVNGSEQT